MPVCSPQHRFLAICVVAVFVWMCPVPVAAQATAHSVERVIDGETLIVSGIGPVRLLGVDVPRTIDAQRPADADQATVFLRTLLTNRTIRLEYDAIQTDAAQRRWAYVYVGTGTLVNAALLTEGLGRLNAEVPFKMHEEFRRAEREAQTARRGLWAATEPPSPTPAPTPGQPGVPRPPVIR
jgi:micrococcal nuclease